MIVGIEGNLGNGKSATMARMALHYNALCTECNGIINRNDVIPILFNDFEVHDCTCETPHPYKIHANFWINGIPNVHYVTCIEDIEKIYNGVFFADEFWSWIDSRGSGFNDINLVVTSIMLKSRKRGYNIVYESKMVHMTDRRVRELTDYVLRPNKYIAINGELTKIEQHMLYPINMQPYLEDTWIIVDELSGLNLDVVEENLFQFKLSDIADKYDTKEEIVSLKDGERSPGLEKGMKVETQFIKALRNCGVSGEIVHSTWSRGWDVVIKEDGGNMAYDVVCVQMRKGSKNPVLDLRNKNIKGLLNKAKKGKFEPYWAFQWQGKWYTQPMLESDSTKKILTCKSYTELINKGE